MLIVELPRGPDCQPLRVAFLGSCRVRYPTNFMNREFIWALPVLTHTAAQSLQALDFIRGTKKIPNEFSPYIFSSAEVPDVSTLTMHLLESLDVVVVEICDLRDFTNDDLYLQQSYFNSNFLTQYAAALLPWLRETARHGAAADATADAAIEALRQRNVDVTPTIERIIRRTRSRTVDEVELVSTLERLQFDKTKTWIFVSHFVIPDMKGAMMDDRRVLCDTVRKAADKLGATFFDPSIFFEEHDRPVILASNGANPNEYADDFNNVVAQRLLQVIRSAAPAAPSPVVHPNVAAAVENVDKLLVPFYAERRDRLGVDGSGLHAHYQHLVDAGSLFRGRFAEIVVNYLPLFDHYVVPNAGLGELAFVLAVCGFDVTVAKRFDLRYQAMEAGMMRLREANPAAADRCLLVHGDLSALPCPKARSLLVADDLVVPHEAEDYPKLLSRIGHYDAIAFYPGNFLYRRESEAERAEVMSQLADVGFQPIKAYSYLWYFEKHPTPKLS